MIFLNIKRNVYNYASQNFFKLRKFIYYLA